LGWSIRSSSGWAKYKRSTFPELVQGSVFLQIFSSDLTSHPIVSPLSGTVVEVNAAALEDPNKTLEDPYGTGWLVRLTPTRLDEEMQLLDL